MVIGKFLYKNLAWNIWNKLGECVADLEWKKYTIRSAHEWWVNPP